MRLRPACFALCLPLALALGARAAATPPDAGRVAHSPVATPSLLPVEMHKHPSCGCCGLWAAHLREAGFTVSEHHHQDMAAVKDAHGVPMPLASCHTAKVGDYFVEGHVPAADIARLLAERPDARGLAVPGMPIGSPGMEHPDGHAEPYRVLLVLRDGSTREFSRHPAD